MTSIRSGSTARHPSPGGGRHQALARAARRVLLCGAACLGALLASPAAPAQPAVPAQPAAHRFRQPAASAPIRLGPDVLTVDERAYLASLPEIRVAIASPPATPYETLSSDGEVGGIHSEMLVALARIFGLRVRPVVLPGWSAALDAVRRRDADMIMTIGVTSERAQFLEFTLGATPWPGALFARTGSADVPLEHARFAIERDYLANDFVRRQFPRAAIVAVGDTVGALAAVADGRADYHLGSLFEAIDGLSRPAAHGVEVRRMLHYGSGYYHFAVRKDWGRLAIILNKGISALRDAGLPQWQAAVERLPPGAEMPTRLALDATEKALLVQRPVWRLGAVRGLSLLNDLDRAGLHSGIAAEYAEQVARRLGIGLQVVGHDSVAQMLDALRRGEIDLVPFLTRTPGRAREFAFSAPYVEMPYLLVARTDGRYFWDLESLRGRRVALAAQHPLREVLARDHPGIRIVDARDGNAAMDAVARGEADAAIEVKLFANLRINSDAGGRLRAVAAVDALPAQFHFAASRQASAMIPIVDRALADIAPAERERMLRRWIAVDLDPAFAWRRHLPVIAVGAAALLGAALLTLWWMRRLSREVVQRRASEQRLHDIGSTLPCVAFRQVVDADGKPLANYFSPGSEAFLGFALDPGKTMLENLAPFLTDDGRRQATEAVRHSLRTGEPLKLTCSLQRPGQTPRWLHCEVVRRPARDGAASWTGYVVDVTTERELQQRLADEAHRRNLMLASASHELRAPAQAVALALHAFETGPPGERGRALAIARDATQTLTERLGDVLDAAQLNHGELRLVPRAVALRPWIERLAGAARAGAERKGLAFELAVAADLPDVVTMDPLRVRQVVDNLLGNAVKYTDRGRVALQLGMRSDSPRVDGRDDSHGERSGDGDGGGGDEGEAGARGDGDGAHGAGRRLVVTVTDTGRGIAAEQLGRVFTPFTSVAASSAAPASAPEGSSGLGLSICKRLASLMGGRIELRSRPGHGTTATLDMPLRSAEPEPAGVAGRAVLLCDDDDVSRMLMAQLLARHGLDVELARSGTEALARLRRGGVGLLVTDLRMSGMSGAELLRSVDALVAGGLARPRVVVCSGDAPHGCDPASFDAFIAKPIDVAALLATLAEVGFAPPVAIDPAD